MHRYVTHIYSYISSEKSMHCSMQWLYIDLTCMYSQYISKQCCICVLCNYILLLQLITCNYPGKTTLHLLARYMQEKQETCKICKNTVLQDLQEKFLQESIPFLAGDFASLQDKYLLAILNVLAKKEFS